MNNPLPVKKFLTDQLSVWPLAANHFRALKSARIKDLQVGGIPVKAQCNPARIQSSLAGDPDETFTPEGCFLCEEYRPPEQGHLRFEGRKGRLYRVRVNPYPIFPNHLVISRDRHVDQSIWRCYVDMLDLTRDLKGYTIFYNGPKSGASKPDHMHFQACPSGLMPLERAVSREIREGTDALRHLTDVQDARLYHYEKFTRGVFVLRAQTAKSAAKLFYRLLDCMPILPGEKEPRFNVLSWHAGGEYRTLVIFRSELRSHHFYAQGDEHFTMSIGCADIAGFFICPVEEEFERLDATVLEQMLEEVSITADTQDRIIRRLTRTQRTLDVGIMSAQEIHFEIISDGAGTQVVRYADGRIDYNGMLYRDPFVPIRRTDIHPARRHDRRGLPLGAQAGAEIRRFAAFHRGRRQSRRRQPRRGGGLPAQRHFIRDERLGVRGISEGACRDFAFLGDGPDRTQEENG